MTRILAVVSGVLLLLALALGLGLQTQRKATAALTEKLAASESALASEKKLRTADVASMTTRLQLAEKARTAKVRRDDATHQAIQQSPQWASERVPDAILDAISM